MNIFGISRPIGGAVPNFGIRPQNRMLMKYTKFCFDSSKFGRDTASEPILDQPLQGSRFLYLSHDKLYRV